MFESYIYNHEAIKKIIAKYCKSTYGMKNVEVKIVTSSQSTGGPMEYSLWGEAFGDVERENIQVKQSLGFNSNDIFEIIAIVMGFFNNIEFTFEQSDKSDPSSEVKIKSKGCSKSIKDIEKILKRK